MNNSFKKLSFLLLMAFTILGTACSGGGSDGGGPTEATISADNAQALATAGTEGVKQAVNASASTPAFAKTAQPSAAQKITVMAVQDFGNTSFPCSNGTATVDSSASTASKTILSYTFNNCVYDGVTINGTMTITFSADTYTITANLAIIENGVSQTINYSATCSTGSTSLPSCTYNNVSASGVGIDGRTYSVSNASVSSSSSGYNVSATVTDPEHGAITVTTIDPLTFTCSNGLPDSGKIEIKAGGKTMTVTFNDCTSFTIDFDGSSNTYNWPS